MATPAEFQAFIAAMTAAMTAANDASAANTQAATAAIQAAVAAIPAAPAIPAGVPAPLPFALLPGSATVNPLTFSKNEDLKIYNAATKGLEKKFDLKEDNLHLFLTEVKERVRTYGWNDIVTVPDASVPPVPRNLLINFGQLTLENCRAHATTYYNTQTRNAQNSMFLYQFLHESLTEEAKAVMVSNLALYSITDIPIGILYLKLIIGKASIDTKAKVLLLREQVANLHVKIGDFKGNVREFNTHVDQIRTALEGRGQRVDELTMHLFRAYETVQDPTFNRFIQNQREKYETDEVEEEITVDALMLLACNKYDLISHRNAMPGDNAEKIIALEARIQSLQASSTSPSDKDATTDGKGVRRSRPRHPEWKLVAPKAGEAQVKKVGTKTFNWCPYHKLWSIHTAQECRKAVTAAPPKEATAARDSNAGVLQPDPKYTAILRAAKAVFDAEADDSN
jgi:hypothetical protein